MPPHHATPSKGFFFSPGCPSVEGSHPEKRGREGEREKGIGIEGREREKGGKRERGREERERGRGEMEGRGEKIVFFNSPKCVHVRVFHQTNLETTRGETPQRWTFLRFTLLPHTSNC
ncbi:hypothetical protein FKM82_012878 [Ascaphus truei]